MTMPEEPAIDSTPTELTKAVRELVASVRALDSKLKKNYPDREEVRRQGRQRAMQFLAFGLVLVVIANLVTISLVSYCFLAPSGTIHQGCRAMPGYSRTVDEGQARLARFELLIGQIQKNKMEIHNLKLERGILEVRMDRLEKQRQSSQ